MRKLHLLFAAVPLGAFLFLHLSLNAASALGGDSVRTFLVQTSSGAVGTVFELIGVWLPLTLHFAYSSVRAATRGDRITSSKRGAVWVLRLSGAASLLFVGYHLLQFRVPRLLGRLEPSDLVQALQARLSSTTASGIPLVAALYLLGLAATVFHGCYGFVEYLAAEWPARSAKRATRLATGLGVALFALGVQTVVYCATGSRLLFFL